MKIQVGDYYTEAEVTAIIDDMITLHAYLHGRYDAIINGMYKKEYVDAYRTMERDELAIERAMKRDKGEQGEKQ
jgi:hypothetical protein